MLATTFKKTLGEKGIIFCSISEAIKEHPELVQKYIGSVVPQKDNFYACQFHPEKSAGVGEQILKNFINMEHE